MADRVGQHLGNYRLTRLLGRGGFAEVYLGEHLRLKTQAAIKVLHTSLEDDDVVGFLREAQTVARLKHPHIVRVFDFEVENHTPFLVMDYLPNGNIRSSHPKGTPLPLETIVTYVRQVASALQYAHDEKLIHRDIKPENMLLDRDNTLVLSDFGIALMAQSSRYQSMQEVAGTAAYMAPEQFEGKPRRASDQYALSVVVYEWLTGDRPFHGSFSEIASQHLFVPPPPLHEKVPGLLPTVEKVVFTALAKDPQQRFGSVQAFAHALEQACLTAQDTPFVGQSQPFPSTGTAIPSSRHIWPVGVASSSNQTVQPDIMPPLSSEPLSSQRRLSRRAIVVGLAGLAVAGSGITWLALSRSASGPVAKSSSTVTPVHTSAPSPTSPSPPLGATLYTYRGHARKIRALAWSPDGTRVASAGDDYTVQVWNATTGNNALTYHGHTSYVEGVAWSPDSKRIVSGSADGTAQIWDATTGSPIYTYRGHISTHHSPTIPDHAWVNRVDWSRDGTRIVSCDQSGVGGHVVTAQVWEAATGRTIVTYTGHTNGIYAVAWSPDGTRGASCGYDGTLQIWDASNGNTIAIYRSSAFLFGLSWSPDGKRIAVGSTDTTVLVLDATNGSIIYPYRGHTDWVKDVSWSRDSTRIASGGNDQTIHVFKAATGEDLFMYRNQSGHIDAVEWSPNSKLIASGNDVGDSVGGAVQVWEAV